MFITKKKLTEREAKINAEWERKFAEYDERRWRMESDDRYREDVSRHFSAIEKRIYELEKKAGLAEETVTCPMAPKTSSF